MYAELGTNLKPGKPTRRAPIGSGNLEKFLHFFESALLEANNKEILQLSNEKDKSFNKMFDNLRQDGSVVVVPMDKTNNYITVTVKKFHSWVLGHLSENMDELSQKMIINLHRKAELYATKLKPMLAKGEMDFLNKGTASKAIPQPKLLVKDHKDKEENGDYPARLVLPATNVMAIF
eukprot:9807709-Ditylum_brightwellii.AAC.1